MSSKRNHEHELGSDSFLDVVSNMVGILIILVVVAGLRVRQGLTPLPETQTTKPPQAAEIDRDAHKKQAEAIEAENHEARLVYEQALAERTKQIQQRRQELEKQSQELQRWRAEEQAYEKERSARLAEISRAEAETRRLEQEIAKMASELTLRQAESDKQKQFQSHLADENARADRLTRELETQSRQADQQKKKAGDMELATADLEQELRELRIAIDRARQAQPIKQTPHFGTPIAETVRGHEAHFRVANGKIADTKLEALIERLRRRFQARLPTATVVDNVGPIGGFSMKYTLLVNNPPLSEQAKDPFVLRAQLTQFEIVPERPDLGETREQFLRDGSEFLRALELQPPREYAVTLWVYPDSFELAKSAEIYLHEHNYTVAIRPLPLGFPITGSPWGTESDGQ